MQLLDMKKMNMDNEMRKLTMKRPDTDYITKTFMGRIILQLTMIISLIVWAVLGLILYVPMVLRMVVYYSSMVFVSVFHQVDLPRVRERLEYAIEVYPERFRRIITSFHERGPRDEKTPHLEPINWQSFIKAVWVDAIWMFVFWATPTFCIFPEVTLRVSKAFGIALIWLLAGALVIALVRWGFTTIKPFYSSIPGTSKLPPSTKEATPNAPRGPCKEEDKADDD